LKVKYFIFWSRHLKKNFFRRIIGDFFLFFLCFLCFFLKREVRSGNGKAKKKIPKIIWIYWDKGENAAPKIINICINSWKVYNPKWEVRVLDSDSIKSYCDLNYLPKNLRIQLFTDMLRLDLLNKYGGVWVDSTCLCNISLDTWLDDVLTENFFVFSKPGPDRLISNWFIASEPNGIFVKIWLDSAKKYWTSKLKSNHIGPGGRIDQFIHHFIFEWEIKTISSLKKKWQKTKKISSKPSHVLQKNLWENHNLRFKDIKSFLDNREIKLHKLNWRIKFNSEILINLEEKFKIN
tara:strand:+ start:1111 stop:1986 length:876 start_codon:yes stop_codon:yes gene_type:complete